MTSATLAAAQEVREVEFPHLDDCIFLNAASFGPMPRRTRAAVDEFHALRQQPRRFAQYDFAEPLDRCRRAAASLIGAEVDEIALGGNTSFGLYLAATLLPQICARAGRPVDGCRVVLSDREFPANVLPWLGMRRRGTRVDIVPTDDAGLPRQDALIEELERGDVAVLAVSAVQFASGHRADLARLGAACRRHGALLVVDAIQAAGAVPIDVRAQSIDVLACGGQKWLCGPFGAGFAYVRQELCEALEPPLVGWLSTTAAQEFTRLLDYESPPVEDARRFERGSGAVQDLLGLAHSIELILELGVAEIERHVRSIQQPLLDWIEATPHARLASPAHDDARSAIVCVRVQEAERVHAELSARGVVCVVREGALRFAPHFYNTRQELERLVTMLEEVVP